LQQLQNLAWSAENWKQRQNQLTSLTGVRSSGPNATSDLCTAASAAASLAGVYNGKLTISSECFDVVTGGFNLGRLSLVGCLAD